LNQIQDAQFADILLSHRYLLVYLYTQTYFVLLNLNESTKDIQRGLLT
jgi:hypothetical protein